MTQPSSLMVTFTNELDEHVRAYRLLYRQSTLAKGDKIVALLMVGAGIYITSLIGFQWWCTFFFVAAVVEWFDLLGTWRTRLAFGRNPKFQEEYRLTFSPQNIRFQTDSIDSTLQWTHYSRLVEDTRVFLLMYGKGMYTLVPKRAFASPSELDAFRALVNAQLAQATGTRG